MAAVTSSYQTNHNEHKRKGLPKTETRYLDTSQEQKLSGLNRGANQFSKLCAESKIHFLDCCDFWGFFKSSNSNDFRKKRYGWIGNFFIILI